MDQDIAKSIAATLRHHGDEYHAQAVEKIASERDALKAEVSMLRGVGCDELDGDDVRGPCGACLKCARRERDDLAKRLRSAEKMRNAFVATSVAFATQEVDATGHGAELMRGTIAAIVRALPIDPATLALIDHAITNAEIPREGH